MIRVGIVDDNQTVVNSLRQNLNYADKTQVVITSDNGQDLLEQLKSCPANEFPDVIITDVNMPGMTGIEVVQHGKALYPKLNFLMLTVEDDEDTLFDAIKAGASGYLLKDERVSVIIDHIDNLVRHQSAPMSSRIARKTLQLLSQSERLMKSGSAPGKVFNLSEREQEVLHLLVEGKTYREIAEILIISPNTVRKHISNIYDKLHVSSKTQAIRLMQGRPKSPDEVTCRIVLTDDHQMILDSLGMMISTIPGMSVVGKLNDSRTVISFLQEHQADLLITDVSMPHIDGLELTGMVQEAFPEMKILVLTVSEDITQMQRARTLGAHGYVLKKAGKRDLTNAIAKIMQGNLYFEELALQS